MSEILVLLLVVVAWALLSRFVLPKMGIRG